MLIPEPHPSDLWEILPFQDISDQNWSHLMTINACVHPKSLQSRPALGNCITCSPPGSSVLGILQARILEWVAISFSRGSSQPRDQTRVCCIAGRRFTVCATREAPVFLPEKSHGQRSLVGYTPWGLQRVGLDLAAKPSPPPY